MTGSVYPLRDTSTMLRRNIKQELRDKVAIGAIIGIPVLFLLLFVFVFGGALKDSVQLPGAPAYIDYVLPGLIIMTAAAGLIGISTQASVDTLRGLLLGTPIGWSWLVALAWCGGLGLPGLAWSVSVFSRRDRKT